MADKRVKSTQTMSKLEFDAHMTTHHKGCNVVSRWIHDHVHVLAATNHGHRSALLSEPTNQEGWK